MKRMTWAIVIGGAVVAATGTTAIALAVTNGPSYTHPWCGPVLAQVTDMNTSVTREAAALSPERHEPLVANWINNANYAAADHTLALQSDIMQGVSYMAKMESHLTSMKIDMMAIKAVCAPGS